MCKPKYAYVAVEDDPFELPFAVGDTMRELAEAVGVSPQNIRDCVRNRGRGVTPLHHTYRVEKIRLASDVEDIADFGGDITVNVYVQL